MAKVRENDADAKITLACHSQGCVVTALAKLSNIERVVFLAPPASVSAKHLQEHFGNQEGTITEDDGTLRVPRRDGSITRMPPKFVSELDGIDTPKLYLRLANSTSLTIINAKQDEVLQNVDLSYLDKVAQILDIDGDHDFSGNNRLSLITTLKSLL